MGDCPQRGSPWPGAEPSAAALPGHWLLRAQPGVAPGQLSPAPPGTRRAELCPPPRGGAATNACRFPPPLRGAAPPSTPRRTRDRLFLVGGAAQSLPVGGA
ncbi:unnamed protein product [Rangifer tarandus platyrhynchus]|uniref:Uncharacterized protein n=2 Tax=Rangifer tarandus platyrhynchus TaxID=3082113 RepID=A0ABN8ZYA2_RANTA|nr:unnamed protein product [Rangifer tarandus platyrhynchus]CAI9712107.1 unnamed protein product [Rangifer tarandus platyrhynchus]